MMYRTSFLLPLLLFTFCARTTLAQDYLDLTLEELMQIEISSVSKKKQKVQDIASAIYVITDEDIRRSSANSIVELLRTVPGLQVSQINNNHWSVASRGFDGLFANKLLVLVDGRAVYLPIFSGVFWADQDTMLEDIARIEIIRGPGATVWGANAVNGVINIITKSARDTNGTLSSGGAGDEKDGFLSVRTGTSIGSDGALRIYAKGNRTDNSTSLSGGDSFDSQKGGRAGFRTDISTGTSSDLTVQGDVFQNDFDFSLVRPEATSPDLTRLVTGEEESEGFNLLTRWKTEISESSEFEAQIFYDQVRRDEIFVDIQVDTFDFEALHRYHFDETTELTWGGGYRTVKDKIPAGDKISFIPSERRYDVYSGFAQLETDLVGDILSVSFGSKVEGSELSGFEYQPSAQLRWQPTESHTLWTSIARATRTPSRVEKDGHVVLGLAPLPDGSLAEVGLAGGDPAAEDLLAFEAGYRTSLNENLTFDVAFFYNEYDNLISNTTGTLMLPSSPDTLPFIPIIETNSGSAEVFGGEFVVGAKPVEWLNLQLAYWYIKTHVDSPESLVDSEGSRNGTAQNKATLRAMVDLPEDFELDLFYRFVDRLQTIDVDSYSEVDARLAWSPSEEIELALIGNNLLDSAHQEYNGDLLNIIPSQVDRELWGKVTLRF